MLGAVIVYVINKLLYTLFKHKSFIQICFLVVKLHNICGPISKTNLSIVNYIPYVYMNYSYVWGVLWFQYINKNEKPLINFIKLKTKTFGMIVGNWR